MSVAYPFPADDNSDDNAPRRYETSEGRIEYAKWWTRRDSNPRPSECHSDATPRPEPGLGDSSEFKPALAAVPSSQSDARIDDSFDDICASERYGGEWGDRGVAG